MPREEPLHRVSGPQWLNILDRITNALAGLDWAVIPDDEEVVLFVDSPFTFTEEQRHELNREAAEGARAERGASQASLVAVRIVLRSTSGRVDVAAYRPRDTPTDPHAPETIVEDADRGRLTVALRLVLTHENESRSASFGNGALRLDDPQAFRFTKSPLPTDHRPTHVRVTYDDSTHNLLFQIVTDGKPPEWQVTLATAEQDHDVTGDRVRGGLEGTLTFTAIPNPAAGLVRSQGDDGPQQPEPWVVGYEAETTPTWVLSADEQDWFVDRAAKALGLSGEVVRTDRAPRAVRFLRFSPDEAARVRRFPPSASTPAASSPAAS